MKIAIYSTPAYLDTTIPLVNELCKTEDIFLIIEYHGEQSVSIWESKNFPINSLLLTSEADVYNFMGKELLNLIDRKAKVTILYYPSIKITNPSRILSTTLLIKYLHKVKPDIIDIHGLHAVPAMPFLSPIKMIITLHDPTLHSGEEGGYGYKIHKKIAIRYADCIIVHDKKSAKVLSQQYNLAKGKIASVFLGTYSTYLHWLKPQIEEEETVLFFGRISPYKGIEYLLKAEPLIARKIPDLKIIIAGQGDFSVYEKMIKDKKRYEIYNHYIPNELLAQLFQRAACVVLPYTDATQSGVLMTAYAFNKPVVVSDVGGLPEVVDNGKTGFVVPPRDENSLARAIINLLKDNHLRKQMKENIKKKSMEELSWEKIARQTLEVYKKAIHNWNVRQKSLRISSL